MSNVLLERYYFVLYDGALTLKISKMALNGFCDKTLHLLSWTYCAPTSSTLSTSDINAKLTAVEHVLHVLAHHSQIIAQT